MLNVLDYKMVNKGGVSNLIGYIIILVLVLAIVGFPWMMFSRIDDSGGFGCFEAYIAMEIDSNKTCVHDNGDLSLFVEMKDRKNKDSLGLQLFAEPEYVDYELPSGNIVKKRIDNNLIFLNMSEYDFPKSGGVKEILIEGDYGDLEYLGMASARIYPITIKTCDSYAPMEKVARCDE